MALLERLGMPASRVARASAWLDDAEALTAWPTEDFLADVKSRDLASFYIFLTIQECIDLAAHRVADAGWRVPDDAASLFDVLADHEEIDRDLAQRLRGMVGLRDRIEYEYASVDHARVQSEFREGASTLRRFLTHAVSAAGL